MSYRFRKISAIVAVLVAGFVGGARLHAQTLTTCPGGSTGPTPSACIPNQVLNAQFTNATITINGQGTEAAWATSTAQALTIPMNSTALASSPTCGLAATVKTLWDGNLLYILVQVTDPAGIKSGSSKGYFLLDFYNQKWKKYTDSLGAFSLTYNSATSPTFATYTNFGVIKDRVNSFAIFQASPTSYNYEVALNMGGLPRVNGSQVGMDFEVSGVAKTGTGAYPACQLAWADGLASGSGNGSSGGDLQGAPFSQPENSSTWGTVTYTGYDGVSAQALDTYQLNNNLKIANNLNEVIPSTPATPAVNPNLAKFTDLTALNTALANANTVIALGANATQAEVDSANTQLTTALFGLRIAGPGGAPSVAPYPDPFDLPPVYTLPDPFTFLNGQKVQSLADWSRRQAEIKSLAQYYEYGYLKPGPYTVTGTVGAKSSNFYTLAVHVTDNTTGLSTSFNARVTVPAAGCQIATSTGAKNGSATGPYPIVASIDGGASTGSATYTNACYAVLSCGYTQVSADSNAHTSTLPYFTLYPFSEVTATEGSTNDTGSLMSWGWGCSRSLDALEYLGANNPTFNNYFDFNKVGLTGFSRDGKSALALGMADSRFGVISPGGSGSGGAAPYRYDSIGEPPCSTMANFGHVYPWTTTAYSVYEENDEAMADHIWHNPWNSNQMFPRFLVATQALPGWFPMDLNTATTNATDYTAPGLPVIGSQLYPIYCPGHGWGERLPFDHHEVIAAIAPRAVIVNSTNNDYSDDAEGDAIGVEGAKAVYQYLGVPQNLAYDSNMTLSGHGETATQVSDFVAFMNMYFYNLPLSATTVGVNMLNGSGNQITTGQSPIYVDPYGATGVTHANIYNTYFGGLSSMMPWLATVPHANLLTALSVSAGSLSPTFSEGTTSYSLTVPNTVTSTTVTATAEASNATITVNGQPVSSGQASASFPLTVGNNSFNVAVTAVDGAVLTYQVVVTRETPPQLITTSSFAKLGDGSYQATVTVSNSGGTAQNVVLTGSVLGSANGTPATVPLGTIGPGGNAVATISFPASAGVSGTKVIEKLTGTYTGGTFGGSFRATLP
jgi:hypothetical protein